MLCTVCCFTAIIVSSFGEIVFRFNIYFLLLVGNASHLDLKDLEIRLTLYRTIFKMWELNMNLLFKLIIEIHTLFYNNVCLVSSVRMAFSSISPRGRKCDREVVTDSLQ